MGQIHPFLSCTVVIARLQPWFQVVTIHTLMERLQYLIWCEFDRTIEDDPIEPILDDNGLQGGLATYIKDSAESQFLSTIMYAYSFFSQSVSRYSVSLGLLATVLHILRHNSNLLMDHHQTTQESVKMYRSRLIYCTTILYVDVWPRFGFIGIDIAKWIYNSINWLHWVDLPQPIYLLE